MQNVMLGFPNIIESAALSSGSWQSTLPLNNLKDRVQAKVARSTDTALNSAKFVADFGSNKTVRALAIANHNFSTAAKVLIKGIVPGEELFNSGWIDVWPTGYVYTDYKWLFSFILPNDVDAQYWSVEIDDTTNPDGHIQFGRVFIGPAWQPEFNMSFGNGVTWENSTDVQTTLGGVEYFNEKESLRVVNFSIDYLSEDEAMEGVFEIGRRAGVSKEVLYIYDADDTTHALRRRFIGRLRKLNPIEHPNIAQHTAAFEIKETR
jgi:hypothetical protein